MDFACFLEPASVSGRFYLWALQTKDAWLNDREFLLPFSGEAPIMETNILEGAMKDGD